MTAHPFPLPSFEEYRPGDTSAEPDPAGGAEAYEAGYQNGWSDAVKAQEGSESAIREAFGRNLRDLGFTYFEARAHVMTSVTAFLSELVAQLFTPVLSAALARRLEQAILRHLEEVADTPVKLRVAPGDRDRIDDLIGGDTPLPVEIVTEETLADGQAYLALGDAETRFDVAELKALVTEGLAALSDSNEELLRNG